MKGLGFSGAVDIGGLVRREENRKEKRRREKSENSRRDVSSKSIYLKWLIKDYTEVFLSILYLQCHRTCAAKSRWYEYDHYRCA